MAVRQSVCCSVDSLSVGRHLLVDTGGYRKVTVVMPAPLDVRSMFALCRMLYRLCTTLPSCVRYKFQIIYNYVVSIV